MDNEWIDVIEKCEVRLTDDIKPPPPVLQVDVKTNHHVTIMTKGNISVFKGQAKSRKTFAITMMVADVIKLVRDGRFKSPRRMSVVYFDTEQSFFYVQQIVKRVNSISGGLEDNFRCFALRHMTAEQRKKAIEIAFYNMRCDIIVVDGVRDLVMDINDQKESTSIVNDLMRFTGETNKHLITVLHENPSADGGGKLRGHIGTELMNKAETVIEVMKVKENGNYSVIKPFMTRGMDFEPIYFTINDGIPMIDENFYPESIQLGGAPF